ncbi:hypothetical protein Pmani_023237 [Petrolisthes manimaculis]|uniref:Alanine--tRNA ligase n=1 Tax=Petrolisthes manimaculis TaxID=1843537 RepID=A0AAE1TZT0_9EUCA|nr:hypothetical protein Pmani_023237 [Petrolisthes manimaculis]
MQRRVNLLRVCARVAVECVRGQHWSSHRVRNTFIEYFKNLGHHHVASSPVVPWNDPSLEFVNAGMNQFKSVFLDECVSPHTRATSSQRCIRVGGKHNDLAEVGRDTYHHTFFEMLGSWSFGDYFKEDACVMAWRLLTEVYRLPPSRLYVTYFAGDESLALPPDLKVRDIWRAIGVPDERILPYGLRDNFWEMGLVGPCGPCTEIHYDHLDQTASLASQHVNTDTNHMIELWNIVFIQYERLKDGRLRNLDHHYVDTGMGLERLTAVLNGCTSNYDTDLFTPIFSKIQQLSDGCDRYGGRFSEDGRCLDTAYRILADHTRMMTVALADGAFPEQCYPLQKIMRRALTIGCQRFGLGREEESLGKLAEVVVDTLGQAHPELTQRLHTITRIITHEETNYHTIKDSVTHEWNKLIECRPELSAVSDYSCRRIIEGVSEITPHIDTWRKEGQVLPGDVVFNLYRTYGFNLDLIHELAGVYGLKVDQETFETILEKYKINTRNEYLNKLNKGRMVKEEELLDSLRSLGLPTTNDDAKYIFELTPNGYEFPPLETKILALITEEGMVEWVSGGGQEGDTGEKVSGSGNKVWEGDRKRRRVSFGTKVGVITESTNFYYEAGGQEGDTGRLYTDSVTVQVDGMDSVGDGYLVHWGTIDGSGRLGAGEAVTSVVDQERRLGCMRHHTATHLLNSAVKSIVDISRQTSSSVTSKECFLHLQTYQPLTPTVIQRAQDLVKRWIGAHSPVNRITVPFQDILKDSGVTLIPGEIYPPSVHVISTSLGDGGVYSLEPCCGTHISNTAHLQDFVVEDVIPLGHNNWRIRGLCGEPAVSAETNGAMTLHQLDKWRAWEQAGDHVRLLGLQKDIEEWLSKNKDLLLPYTVRCTMTQTLEEIRDMLKNSIRVNANAEMRNEVLEVISKQKFGPIVHLVKTNYGSSRPRLVQGHKLVKDRPMLLLARTGQVVVGRSALPQAMAESGVSATDWLRCVEDVLGGSVEAPPDKNPTLVANFRSNELPDLTQTRLEEALEASSKYIEKFACVK